MNLNEERKRIYRRANPPVADDLSDVNADVVMLVEVLLLIAQKLDHIETRILELRGV